MTFKVGDRVRHKLSGEYGTVTEIAGEKIWIDGDKSGRGYDTESSLLLITTSSSFEENVRRHTDKIASLLIAKNKQYSNSALDPIRVFSKSDRMEQLRVRADDKLSRIRNGDTSEDAITDLCGYLILMKIAEESE